MTASSPSIEAAVRGLGYELVETTRVPGGTLRVTIDVSSPQGEERFVTVDDCETVSRQLSRVLEVEGVDYARLEVSSPGLDRPLKNAADFVRFAGEQVDVTLKAPFQGRKRWRGELQVAADGGAGGTGWRVVMTPAASDPAGRRGKRTPSAARPKTDAAEAAGLALDFTLAEVREARLVPAVDFKGHTKKVLEVSTDEP